MKLFHLYLEGGPAPPMTSYICVFHLGIGLVILSFKKCHSASPRGRSQRIMTELRNEIEKLLGPAVQVNDEVIRACQDRNEFGGLSFDLFREATGLAWVTCNAYYETGDGPTMNRNQAVCAGFLSRISKIMVSVAKLSSGEEHGEVVQILNRCILESSVDLQYLLLKDDDAVYERFVKFGLKGERELYDIIQKNITNRNGQDLEIERDMLLSIARTCEHSGMKIEEIDPKAGSWGGSYRDRMTEIGLGEGYPIFQGMTSQAVHGSWSDLIRNYLNKSDTGYEPKPDHTQTEGKLFGPTAFFATNAAKVYIDRFFGSREAEPLVHRLDDLQQRLALVENSRPGWEPVP